MSPVTPTVLLVTEDGDLRAAATRMLTREGYRVVAAAHSGHALLAGLSAGPIDVLAAELSMQEMSGPALANRLRRVRPDLPALYFADADAPRSADTLVRPFTGDELVARLRAATPPASGTSCRRSAR